MATMYPYTTKPPNMLLWLQARCSVSVHSVEYPTRGGVGKETKILKNEVHGDWETPNQKILMFDTSFKPVIIHNPYA